MKSYILLTLVLLCTSIACAQQKELRTLRPFNTIVTKEGYDIFLTEGNSESVSIITENIDPEKILTNITGETLTIGTKKGKYQNIKVRLYITFKHLNSIVSYGSGKIDFSPYRSEKLSLELKGSNKVTVAINSKAIDISLTGSSEVNLSGGTDKLSINLSGSGKINAFDLVTKQGLIKLSGSGVVRVNIKERLNIECSGSGAVYYKGNPSEKQINRTGPGIIEPVNE